MPNQPDPTNPVPAPELRPPQRRVAAPRAIPELDQFAAEVLPQALGAMSHKWNPDTGDWTVTSDVPTRLRALKLHLELREQMPAEFRAQVEAGFRSRQPELVEIAASPGGRRLLLKTSAVDADWLRKFAPAPDA